MQKRNLKVRFRFSKSRKFIIIFNFLCLEPGPIAKSNIILDVKPWDDETDMKEMEGKVRSIEADGLVWGVCKYLF